MSLNNIKPNPTPSALTDAQGREFETLPYEVWKVISDCDAVLRAHGMHMKILCQDCIQDGHEQPYVMGDNVRGSSKVELKCPHKRRCCLFT